MVCDGLLTSPPSKKQKQKTGTPPSSKFFLTPLSPGMFTLPIPHPAVLKVFNSPSAGDKTY